jgi:hypothetical protein
MPYIAAQDLTGKHPIDTRHLLVTTDGVQLFDGTGNLLEFITNGSSNDNIDGGIPESVYGGTTGIDGGIPESVYGGTTGIDGGTL